MKKNHSLSHAGNTPVRQGVTLLLVLTLMSVFAMLIITFMIIASHARRTAQLTAQHLLVPSAAAVGDRFDLDDALAVLLFGSNANPAASGIAQYSILENLYGYAETDNVTGDFSKNDNDYGFISFSGTAADLSDLLGKNLIGNVLTVCCTKDNVTKSHSTFIRNTDIAKREITFVPFTGDAATDISNADRCVYLINPLPFSGSNNAAGYTSPDTQNLFLAWNDTEWDDTKKSSKLKRIIPSFHRPAAAVILRPSPNNHRNFTGSNPAATLANWGNFLENGPWDVDNDGDGRADGIWVDAGLAARYDEITKSYYKPLVSYYVVDLDGRINVNTLGNLVSETLPGQQFADDKYGSVDVKGSGFGAAELTSTLIPQGVLNGDTSLNGRYGNDKIPGKSGDTLTKERNGVNLDAYSKGGLIPDWFGYSPLMFDPLGNRVVAVPQTAAENPYLMNPYYSRTGSGDTPFLTGDLEFLLRSVGDLDYNELASSPLRELLGDTFDHAEPKFPKQELRYNITTRSSDIPVSAPIYGKVLKIPEINYDINKAAALWNLLPEEIRRGEKVNLNRLTLRNDWLTGGNNLLKAKAKFAQELFYLLFVLAPATDRTDPAKVAAMAQWAVNFVDFIDPDQTMTPFLYKPNALGSPYDNTTDMANLLDSHTPPPAGIVLIWGMEKPEIALTETFAVHNRCVADTPTGGRINDTQNSDTDFDQVKRPQGSLFVELYRQGDPRRAARNGGGYPANDLIESNGSLHLAKKTASGGDYIWRIAIGEAIKTADNQFRWNEGHANKNALRQLTTGSSAKYPQFFQWQNNNSQYHPDLQVPERFIWFGTDFPQPAGINADEIKRRSFVHTSGTSAVLTPNSYLIIAPRLQTSFSADPANTAAKLELDGITLPVMIASNPVSNTEVNVSEPLPVWNSGTLNDSYPPMTGIVDTPFDNNDPVLHQQRGTVACYKTICLQRLADPNRPHHPIANPYLTVDWNMLDLQVINSEKDAGGAAEEQDIKTSNMRFASRSWKNVTGNFSHLWDRTLSATELADSKAGLGNLINFSAGFEPNRLVPQHTFGVQNFSVNSAGEAAPYAETPEKPFLHFPWHDAPLSNTYELMLVPASAPSRFGIESHDNGEAFFNSSGQCRFRDPHQNRNLYLNFFQAGGLRDIFDYVRVPSRFAGTVDAMREPGKINLNTLTEKGWETLSGNRSSFPAYADLQSKRPFETPQQTLLDSSPATSTPPPLFKPQDNTDNPYVNPYTALEHIMRLADVTTTRSNVFAVWITVGYFDCEQDGRNLGKEKGLSDGLAKRHRAFYLIDRSVPVGFRRGEKLNTGNVVIKRTILE